MAKTAKPPRPSTKTDRTTTALVSSDDFNKPAWCLQLKQLNKESLLEERARFGALAKQKSGALIQDLEKIEKKYEIGLMRERD